jgi:hypothetical protein
METFLLFASKKRRGTNKPENLPEKKPQMLQANVPVNLICQASADR